MRRCEKTSPFIAWHANTIWRLSMSEGPGGGGEVRKGSGSGKVVKGTERAADYVGGEVMLRFDSVVIITSRCAPNIDTNLFGEAVEF